MAAVLPPGALRLVQGRASASNAVVSIGGTDLEMGLLRPGRAHWFADIKEVVATLQTIIKCNDPACGAIVIEDGTFVASETKSYVVVTESVPSQSTNMGPELGGRASLLQDLTDVARGARVDAVEGRDAGNPRGESPSNSTLWRSAAALRLESLRNSVRRMDWADRDSEIPYNRGEVLDRRHGAASMAYLKTVPGGYPPLVMPALMRRVGTKLHPLTPADVELKVTWLGNPAVYSQVGALVRLKNVSGGEMAIRGLLMFGSPRSNFSLTVYE